jgi:hypothetical protein
MKFEIENGSFSGTAEWKAPGQVMVEMPDQSQQEWFEQFFASEDSFMGGSADCGEMCLERRDASAEAFTRATRELAAYSYKVRQREAERYGAHKQRTR